MIPLITNEQRAQLLANGAEFDRNPAFDPFPVVKLFTPDAGATWLLAAIEPGSSDIAYGLCDLGLGFAELGSVYISEIETVRGRLGLPVERDLYFIPSKPLSVYAEEAQRLGLITD